MTDRHLAFTVILEDDIPEEQAERVRDAIGMMYHVQQVRPWVTDDQTAINPRAGAQQAPAPFAVRIG